MRSLLIILALFLVSCSKHTGQSDIFLIPEKFEGTIFIIYNHENGQDKKIINNKRVFKIPESGILKTKFTKSVKTHKFPEFYLYDEFNNKTKIKFILPGEYVKSNLKKDEKLIYSFENGQDKNYHFSMIVCAKSSNNHIGKNRYQLLNKVFKKFRENE